MNELSENSRCAVRGRHEAGGKPVCGSGQDCCGRILQNSSGGGIAATLDASYYKGPGARNGKEREFVAIDNEYMDQQNDSQTQPRRKYIVRRLTPTECLRLQGLPDWWCDGANGSDSAIYKMAGNGLAIPCAEDVIGRIVRAYERGW